MLNGSRTRHSGDGHAWNSMSHMQLGRLWGVRIFGRGVRKKGGSDEPPEPRPLPGHGPVTHMESLAIFTVGEYTTI